MSFGPFLDRSADRPRGRRRGRTRDGGGKGKSREKGEGVIESVASGEEIQTRAGGPDTSQALRKTGNQLWAAAARSQSGKRRRVRRKEGKER